MLLNILYGFLILVGALILLIVFLYFYTKHKLNFDPVNRDINKIVIYGDVRSSIKKHHMISKLIYAEKPDMVLFTGDIASNSHNFLHYLYYAIIENKIWKNCEYYPVRGNHEAEIHHYKAFLNVPNGNTYYSFDRMGMHFIVLDCWNVYVPLEEVQLEWLKQDLEANKDKPISLALHVPFFTSGKYAPYTEDNIMSLIDKYNILFVFSAHVHSYERSLYKGTYFIVTAGGGAPLYPATRYNPYKVKRVTNHHYCVMNRVNDEYHIKVIDINKEQIDEFYSSKEFVAANKEDKIINLDDPNKE